MKTIHLFGLAVFVFLFSCKPSIKKSELTQAQETLLHYLYMPGLLNDTLSRLYWQMPIDCRGIDSKNKLIYFVYPESIAKTEVLNKIALDSNVVEYSTCTSGDCEFGGLQGNIDGYKAFRMPLKNLKVDTSFIFTCNLKSEKIEVTFNELMSLHNDDVSYNTTKHIDFSPYYGEQIVASNIGAYISKQGKDILIKKIVEKLVSKDDYVELKAQKLLNFVTSQITYSYEDIWYQTEVTKRAHEVLLTGEADCSGMTTLYASLLEEANVPYSLLYFNHHINVGLRGDYVMNNKYFKTIHDTTYVIAETTTPDFMIGMTQLENEEILGKLMFYQIPKQSPIMFEANTYKPLSFIELEVEE